jgi:hypothetical protein
MALSGLGTALSPYLIGTAAGLAEMATLINTGVAGYNTAYYRMDEDIDLSAYSNWTPIGTNTTTHCFDGNFNGDGHKIINLKCAQPHAGLFGYIGNNSGAVYNVGVESGTISSTTSGHAGGICCGVQSNGEIYGCYNKAAIVMSGTGLTAYIGGIAAFNSGGSIHDCYNTGQITSNPPNACVGGIVGLATGAGTIVDCYNRGTVTVTNSTNFGGVCGKLEMTAAVTTSYYLDTSCTQGGTGSVSLTTAQMRGYQSGANMAFDFVSTWYYYSYLMPTLQVFGPEIPYIVSINSAPRPDIELSEGAEFKQDSLHKTASSVTVQVPADATEPQECDYIEVFDGASLVHAGTILGVKQLHMGYADQDYKVFELDIASNADFLASIYVDLIFPDGATVHMILNGNHDDDAWYDEALGEFDGLFDERISPEGITLGTVDDFSLCVINKQANLWGKTVADTLDELCAAAGAYWEVTNDKVFNMRYTGNRDTAPLTLDTDAGVYDLEVSRDAFTLFSAVRVIGSTTGQGALIEEVLDITEDVTSYALSRPISRVDNTKYYGIYRANNLFDRPGALVAEVYSGFELIESYTNRIGVTGLHDDNTAYQFLYSFNSNTIYAKTGYSFPSNTFDEFGDGTLVKVAYYPVVPIITRLVDTELAAEIAATRGGTGIVEYTLNDNSITSFNKAAAAGAAFLANNSKRAKTVSFTTETAGFSVGQILSGTVPYYGIAGDYIVNSVTARIVSGAAGGMWRYDIEASTVNYRDALSPMTKKTTFELGTETQYLPMSLSLLGDTDIETTLTIYAEDPLTWTALEATYADWTAFEATYDDWADIVDATQEVEIVANAYTAAGKALIARALAGGAIDLNASVQLKLYTAANALLATVSPLGTALTTADAAINSFYLYEDDGNGAIDHINVIGADGSIIQQITDIGFTKTDSMVLNITKKDEVQ